MLDLLLIGLLQAAIGEPQASAPPEAASQAQVQPAVPDQAQPDEAEDGDKVVCRRIPRIGTRFTDRVCTTRADDERRRAEDRQNLERRQALRTANGN